MRVFPGLSIEDFRITSPADVTYNCIAWAAGEAGRPWWPMSPQHSFWPEAAPHRIALDAFVRVFRSLGYVEAATAEQEADTEKVAIYAIEGRPTHAARQLPSGMWTSKLGSSFDIEHRLPGIEGKLYGSVVIVMKRVIPGFSTQSQSGQATA